MTFELEFLLRGWRTRRWFEKCAVTGNQETILKPVYTPRRSNARILQSRKVVVDGMERSVQVRKHWFLIYAISEAERG